MRRRKYRVLRFAREYKKNSESTRGNLVTNPSSFVIVLSTVPADQDPTLLATTLVEEHLAACVNVLSPMRSIYRWEGKVEQATEHQLVIKTTAVRVEAVTARLASLHPYDVPEVLVLSVAAGAESYLQWLQANA
jgi:periplasmic divalent cation tolerance protein